MIRSFSATPTITAGAYTTGKCLGGLLTFTGAALNGVPRILSCFIIDKGDQKIAMDLYLSKASFTAAADTATFTISDADIVNTCGAVSIVAGDYVDCTASAIATKQVTSLAIQDGSDANLYGQLVIRGSATYTSTSDIVVIITCDDGQN